MIEQNDKPVVIFEGHDERTASYVRVSAVFPPNRVSEQCVPRLTVEYQNGQDALGAPTWQTQDAPMVAMGALLAYIETRLSSTNTVMAPTVGVQAGSTPV